MPKCTNIVKKYKRTRALSVGTTQKALCTCISGRNGYQIMSSLWHSLCSPYVPNVM